ncbi:hypothetical protein AXG93_891s1110 [Marchantia polymorpha subsp. ruderalis]|uniref:Uncharacterized protein n=1 Tax=Marchantia polymorpha subsp. ruderalis TaxID=1480154 RepID=A0A176VLU1_MARPO|nr:hypothetical protein AXG93_891s1110 [Marchantia polymorpha subsp. ruderalis]
MEPGILIIRSFPVDQSCAAADAPSVGTGREKYKGKRRSKEPREERAPRSDVLEDIYTIEDGWSVHIDPAEEMIKIAGVQVPASSNMAFVDAPAIFVIYKREVPVHVGS